MYENNNYGFNNMNMMGQQGMPMGQGMGMPNQFQQQAQPKNAKHCITLTQEQADLLKEHVPQFNLGIDEKEKYRAICTHTDPRTGLWAISQKSYEDDPEVECSVCGARFHVRLNLTEQEVQTAVNNILDIIQTIKLVYVDMPEKAAINYYLVVALIKKVPGLYKLAVDNFHNHENESAGGNQFGNGNQRNYISEYNSLVSTGTLGGFGGFGGTYAPMGGYGQSQYGQAYQPYGGQPYGGQPMMQQPMGGFGYGAQAQNPNVVGQPMMQQAGQTPNPFGTMGQPQAQAQYAPQSTGYAYTPQQAPAPTAQMQGQPTDATAQPQATTDAPAAPEATADAPKAPTTETVTGTFQV